MKIPEFYPTKQGRPKSVESLDLETGQSHVYRDIIRLDTQYTDVSGKLEDLIREQEERDEIRALEDNYKNMMSTEMYASDRRGFGIR